MTTTMGEMKTVVEKVKESKLDQSVKIMIGGAPITQSYCDSIGADYYTRMRLLRRMLRLKSAQLIFTHPAYFSKGKNNV